MVRPTRKIDQPENLPTRKSTVINFQIFRTGLVESNIRKLVGDLEKSEYILIAHIRPERIELPPEPEGHRYDLFIRVES